MLRYMLRLVLNSCTLLVLLAFLPGLPPYGVDYAVRDYPRVQRTGTLEPNDRLSRLFEPLTNRLKQPSTVGKLHGPEALVVKDHYMYTGIVGGEIVRLDLRSAHDGAWERVFRFGDPCPDRIDEHKCGRPLGIEFDAKGRLLVADGHLGVYRISADFSSAELLVKPGIVTDGRAGMFFDDVSPASNGSVYYTMADTNYPVGIGVMSAFAAGSGRLMRYDENSKTNHVILDKLSFANGVCVSHDESFLLLSETGPGEIRKVHLKGPKSGQIETIARLPGCTDNIARTDKGTFLVAVPAVRQENEFNPVFDVIFVYPSVSRLLTRINYYLHVTLRFLVDHVYASPALERFAYWHLHMEAWVLKQFPSMVVEIDAEGRVVDAWESQSEGVHHVTHATLYDKHLYLGTFFHDHFGRVPYAAK